MTTHTDLIKRLRALKGPARLAAADALEAQDTTIEALRAEVAALTEYNKTRTDELIAAGKQVAALTKEHEFACEIGADYRDKWMAAQEREAKLLEALVDYDNQASEYDGRTSKELGDRIKSLLALPIDDSALMERLKEEYKRGYKAGITTGSMT